MRNRNVSKRVEYLMVRQNSKILVAGGAGFIGSHIVDKLLGAGAEVTVLDNLYTGKMENIEHHKRNKNFHFVKGDVRNFRLVKDIARNLDAVFNDAAIVSVPRSVENPLLANEVNVKGTLNLLKASLDSSLKRFVQASSASVYGDAKTLPIHENLPAKPISPYAVSELAAENYAKVFHKVYGLETVCLRYFNVYGPRQTYSAYSGATTIFVNQLAYNKPPTIESDGEQTRDFVYVEDVASANLLALTKKGAVGEVFNIATGEATTINRLVETLQKVMGKEHLKPVHKEPRSGDIRYSYAGIERARKILGYEPMFPLEKGLKNLAEWYTAKPLKPSLPKKTGKK
jgi:nucleoside-diphosphate-sugar epimerase